MPGPRSPRVIELHEGVGAERIGLTRSRSVAAGLARQALRHLRGERGHLGAERHHFLGLRLADRQQRAAIGVGQLQAASATIRFVPLHLPSSPLPANMGLNAYQH